MTIGWYQKSKDNPVAMEKHRLQGKKWRAANPEKVAGYSLKYKSGQLENDILRRSRTRAKKRGLEFTISIEDIAIPEYCPIMGEKLEYIPGLLHPYSPSLDRIDSTKGYIKGNVQVISTIANRMKWDATQEQLITFCKGVLAKGVGSC